MVYATGSNEEAARQAGIDTAAVKTSVFVVAGALTGAAAMLNAVRFNQIPANGGLGLELTVIASVVVGGASIRGGEATFTGTLLGVALLGAVGPALTFLGVSAYWERAIQGAIILGAVAVDAARLKERGRLRLAPDRCGRGRCSSGSPVRSSCSRLSRRSSRRSAISSR